MNFKEQGAESIDNASDLQQQQQQLLPSQGQPSMGIPEGVRPGTSQLIRLNEMQRQGKQA